MVKFRFIAFAFLLFTLSLWGCGGASPPAGIPAPVSELISVGNPDASGEVTVTGDAGSVNGGSTVTATNTTQTVKIHPLEKLFYGVAYAQVVFQNSVLANADGSFQLKLTAKVGDRIEIVQTVNGQTSPPTFVTVSGNTVDLGTPPQGLALDPNSFLSYVTSGAENQGLVFSVDFFNMPLSFPAPTFTFAGLPGLTAIDLDVLGNRGVSVSPAEDSVVFFDLLSPDKTVVQSVSSPRDVSVLPFSDLAAVGLFNSTESVAIYDTLNGAFQCAFLIFHPQDIPHRSTPFVSFRNGLNSGQQWVVAISQYEDGSWLLSQVDVTSCPLVSITKQIMLPADIVPAGLEAFSFGERAVLSDVASNRVYLANFLTDGLLSVLVGNEPRGVAVNADQTKAYVVNSGDNSLSSINLSDLSILTQTGVGLTPTELGLFNELNQAVVLSTVDNAVILVNLEI